MKSILSLFELNFSSSILNLSFYIRIDCRTRSSILSDPNPISNTHCESSNTSVSIEPIQETKLAADSIQSANNSDSRDDNRQQTKSELSGSLGNLHAIKSSNSDNNNDNDDNDDDDDIDEKFEKAKLVSHNHEKSLFSLKT